MDGEAHGMLVLVLQLVDSRNGEFAWEQTQPNVLLYTTTIILFVKCPKLVAKCFLHGTLYCCVIFLNIEYQYEIF